MPEEKISFGFAKAYYATYTEAAGVITFDTPVAMPGGVEIVNDALGDPVEFYADNMLYHYADNNQGYEGTLTIARVPDSFRQDVLGEELAETEKVLFEYADAEIKPFALMFEFLNDKKARRHVLYNCRATRPSLSSTTKTDSAEVSTLELNYKATPLILNGRPVVKASTTQDTPTADYEGWFTKVFTPPTTP